MKRRVTWAGVVLVMCCTAASVHAAPVSAANAVSPAPSVQSGCASEAPGARLGAPSTIVVALDEDTLWRPRGSEVRFKISSNTGSPPIVQRVAVCFAWQTVTMKGPLRYTPSPLVHAVSTGDGSIEYAAQVPSIPGRPSRRGGGPDVYTGATEYAALAVPVAAMQVVATLADDPQSRITVILPVGITSVWTGLLVLGVCLGLSFGVLWVVASYGVRRRSSSLMEAVSARALAIISTRDGLASLSQFQIILWSFVVAGAAVYVMALSGNLLAISSGTLSLLGIAAGTSVLARAIEPRQNVARRDPAWSQLLLSNPARTDIDVTRVQMLLFTLIAAAFVTVKVAVSYSIPEIPDNFTLLLGISNGVYLAGKKLPDKNSKNVGDA